jgi:hypothetical protein
MKVDDIYKTAQEIGETKSIELKTSMTWNYDATKFKITKSVMAFSNIRDGGRLVLGVDQCPNGIFDPKGMCINHFESFTQDDLQDHLGKYLVPNAKVRIEKVSDGSVHFIVINVEEFDRLPVICGKVYDLTNKLGKDKIIKEGDIFTRTRSHRFESSRVRTHIDMQEILELAIEKGMKPFLELVTKRWTIVRTAR